MLPAQCWELFLNTDVFFSFSCIWLLRFEILIRFGIWVADPDIKDCRSLVLPEPTCMDIQSRILCFVRPSKLLNRFPRNHWLGFHIVTYRTQKFGFQISWVVGACYDKLTSKIRPSGFQIVFVHPILSYWTHHKGISCTFFCDIIAFRERSIKLNLKNFRGESFSGRLPLFSE